MLRYFGGKLAIAPWIVPQLPVAQNYYEPFLGGAAILQKMPRHQGWEMATDLNPKTVNFWIQLRDDFAGVWEAIRVEPWEASMAEDRIDLLTSNFLCREAYDLYDKWYKGEASSPSQAAAWYYLVGLFGFLGAGVSRNGNPAPSRAKSKPDVQRMQLASRRMKGVDIRLGDAFEGIRDCAAEGTLIYADPPYVHAARRSTKSRAKVKGEVPYRSYEAEMNDADHVKLISLLQNFSDRGGMVAMSGYESELYQDLLPSWTLSNKQVYHNAKKKEKTAEKPVEFLWLCPNCSPAQMRLFA